MPRMKKVSLLVGISLVLAGVLLGQTLFASAQGKPGNYRECFASTVWSYSASEINDGEKPSKLVKVPPGWTIVAGGQYRTEPAIILCR
jgi:hypothetical protein